MFPDHTLIRVIRGVHAALVHRQSQSRRASCRPPNPGKKTRAILGDLSHVSRLYGPFHRVLDGLNTVRGKPGKKLRPGELNIQRINHCSSLRTEYAAINQLSSINKLKAFSHQSWPYLSLMSLQSTAARRGKKASGSS